MAPKDAHPAPPATAPVAPNELGPGRLVEGRAGTYRILEHVGTGGFGTTWLAERVTDSHRVLVKVLRLDRVADWKAVELFEREAGVLASLHHPRIPEYIDYFEQPGSAATGLVLVESYVAGTTLEAVRRGQQRLDPAAMRAWLTGLLEVLEYLHDQRPPVIHRDINPRNVILREADGQPVLIDFGTVQAAVLSTTAVGSTAAGTFGYAPLEQFVGRATPASDLYSLAVTFLAVASGLEPEQMPFADNRIQVRAALEHYPIDARLQLLLEEMTEPDAARRPQSARAVLDRLGPAGEAVAAPAPAAISPAGAPGRDSRIEAVARPAPGRPPAAGQAAPEGDPGAAAIAHYQHLAEIAERLGTVGAWSLGQRPKVQRIEGWAVRDDGRLAVLRCGNHIYALDPNALTARELPRPPGESPTPPGFPDMPIEAAITQDATAILIKSAFSDYALQLVAADGTARVVTLSGASEIHFGSLDGFGYGMAMRPDGRMLALIGEGGKGSLYDTESGARTQPFAFTQGDFTFLDSSQVAFSPDGRCLIACVSRGAVALDANGTTHELFASAVAASPDGRWLALTKNDSEDKVHLGQMESIVPLKWRAHPHTLALGLGDVKHLRFSPDARYLAVAGENHALAVVDCASRQLIARITQAHLPGVPVGDIESIGFSADGERLLVFGEAAAHAGGKPDQDVVTVFSMAAGRSTGTIAAVGDAGEPHAFAGAGLWGSLVPPAGQAARGHKQPAVRPAEARRLLAGETLGAVLSGPDLDGATELEARLTFWERERAEGRLTPGDAWHVVEASRGLAHLLPYVVTRVGGQHDGGPQRFGDAPQGANLPAGELTKSLQELAGRTPAERSVLFEGTLPAVADEARRTARQDKRRQRALRPRTGRRRAALIAQIASAALVAFVLFGLGPSHPAFGPLMAGSVIALIAFFLIGSAIRS